MKQYDIVIVGGGVIGGSVAFQLAKRGHKVIVLERTQTGSGASNAAAGMLGAQTEMQEAGPLFEMARESRALFPELADELKELTGIDIGLVQKGLLNVARTEEEAHQLRKMIAFQSLHGEAAEWLSPHVAVQMEPNLSKEIEGAMWIPGDGQVSAPLLTSAYLRAAAVLGVDVLEYTDVKALKTEHGCVVGVETQSETIACESVVVASGVMGNELLKQVGVSLDVFPVKGECFSVITHKPLITSTIFSHGCYLVPKSGGRLVVGATMVDRSFDVSVSIAGLLQLQTKAAALVPQILSAQWEKAWAGLRPQTPDEYPYLGETSVCRGLYIAMGHFRNGILLSPLTGKLIAEWIGGNRANESRYRAFHPDRHLLHIPNLVKGVRE